MSNIKSMILAYMNDWHGGYWNLNRGIEEGRKILAEDVIHFHAPGAYKEVEASKINRYEEKLIELIEEGKITETKVSENQTEYEVR